MSLVSYLLEHHLVESPDVARAVSEEFGIPYHYTSKFSSALAGHARFLNDLGKAD